MSYKIKIIKNLLDVNERIAIENRSLFDLNKIYVINLMSSPGAGKTSLVEETIKYFKEKCKIFIIEADIQNMHDAKRIAALNIPVIQINTGRGCHIDANMVKEAISNFELKKYDLLIIENVGNLVCPAEFKVGENKKIMILSVPEGDDKPSKYPLMFQKSSVLIINKIDLLPYVNFNIKKSKTDTYKINSKIKIFDISCQKKQGLINWFNWLENEIKNFRISATTTISTKI